LNDRDRTIQWIRAVLNALQEVDEKKGIELLHACGRACSKGSALLEGAERIRKEHGERGDVDSLFEAFTKDPEFNMFVNAELADKPSCP